MSVVWTVVAENDDGDVVGRWVYDSDVLARAWRRVLRLEHDSRGDLEWYILPAEEVGCEAPSADRLAAVAEAAEVARVKEEERAAGSPGVTYDIEGARP